MNDWSSENMTGANIDPVSNNQKLTNHPYLPILLTALMLLLLFVTTAFIAYQTTNRQEAATVEVSIEDQPIPTSTLNIDKLETQDLDSDLSTYSDEEAGFQIQYPSHWTVKIINPTEFAAGQSNTSVYFGSIELEYDANKITLVFGDGFGGAPCGEPDSGYSEGELLQIESKAGIVNICNFSSETKTIFEGTCGNCGIYNEGNGFKFRGELDKQLFDQAIDIISTFEFID